MSRANADKFIVRLPDGMREEISVAAEASGRSMNAEIVHRIRKFSDQEIHAKLDFIISMLRANDPDSFKRFYRQEFEQSLPKEGTPEYFMELEKRIADNQVSTMRMPDPRRTGHMPLQIAPRVPKSRKR